MKEDKNYLNKLIKKEGKNVWFHLATTSSANDLIDEDRGEAIETLLNAPIPIKCIVVSVSPQKLIWKFQGIKTYQAEDLLMPKRYLKTVKLSYKIVYDGNEYYGWRSDTNQCQIQVIDDSYIRVSIARVE